MSRAARLLASVFPLTRRGCAFLAAAFVVLSAGALRAELAALFWGTAVLFLIAVSVLGTVLSSFRIGRLAASGRLEAALNFPETAARPGVTLPGRLSVRLPAAPPAVRTDYVHRAAGRGGNVFTFRIGLAAGKNDLAFSVPAPRRGLYEGRSGFLSVRDVFGFARREVPLPGGDRLVVRPGPAEEAGKAAKSEGGERIKETREKRKTDEFLEVRDYVPGDDQRRLDWKLYAHSGRLIVRVGEDAPPPDAFIVLVVDTTADPALYPGAAAGDAVDALAAAAARMVLDTTGRGRSLVLASTEGAASAAAEPGRTEEALNFLGSLAPRRGNAGLLPEAAKKNENAGLIVLALPGSAALPGLLGALAGRRRVDLYLAGPRESPDRAGHETLRGILFAPPEGAGRESRRKRKHEAALREAAARRMSADIETFLSLLGKQGHVGIV